MTKTAPATSASGPSSAGAAPAKASERTPEERILDAHVEKVLSAQGAAGRAKEGIADARDVSVGGLGDAFDALERAGESLNLLGSSPFRLDHRPVESQDLGPSDKLGGFR